MKRSTVSVVVGTLMVSGIMTAMVAPALMMKKMETENLPEQCARAHLDNVSEELWLKNGLDLQFEVGTIYHSSIGEKIIEVDFDLVLTQHGETLTSRTSAVCNL